MTRPIFAAWQAPGPELAPGTLRRGNWTRPQLQLPILPAGLTPITNDIAFYRKDGKVV